MFKKLMSAVAAAALCVSLAACGATATSEAAAEATATPAPAVTEAPAEETASAETADGALRVAGLKGPTTMGLVNLMAGEDAADYDFEMYGKADEIVPQLVKGELDAAAVPANLAATLYQKTNGAIEVACINTLGVLYVVENGETVNSVEDLKGKTIVTTGKGTTPEYVLRYILTENGVDPDSDVTLDFYSEATEALAQLQAGTSTIAMLPQPFVTSALAQVEGLRVALDMNEEWEKVAGSKLVTGVLVARKDAVEADPARFAAFMDGYKASVEAANTDLENTAALCEQYGIVAKAALAQKALPNCNIVFETGDEMKTDLETYFNVLYAADPTSVGGQLPAGLGLRGPRQHGPGGQLHRPDAGEGAPGWLAPQQGGARLVKCHLQGVLEGVVHLLRRTVQLPAPHTDRSLPHPLGPVHLGADGGPHGAAAQGEAGGVGLPLQCTALPGGIFRPLLREEGEHHLLHRVFIALRLVVIVVQIQIQLHSPPSSREKSSGRRPLSSAWPPSGRGCSSAPAPGWRWPRGRDRRGSPPSAPPAASGTA